MRMVPEHLKPKASPAERRIFDQLADLEVPGWDYALHSLNLPEHERKRVGEIDFLLLGPRGVLVLEAKGGQVSCSSGVWHSQDLRGRSHRLKESPFEQARSAAFALEARLRGIVGSPLVSSTVFGHAAVFPDVEFLVTSVEWAAEMVVDRRGIEQDGWAARLDVLGQFWENKPGPRRPLTADEVDRYLAGLRPDFDLVPTLRHLSRDVDEELVALTENQYRALDAYGRNPRLVFEGGAGTGKTMLAAELSRRASAQGSRVLLTCRSPVLAGFVSAQPGLDDVTVLPFSRVHGSHRESRFDLVVVDEAQDLVNVKDLEVIDEVLAGGLRDGSWVMLLDSNNQRGLVGSYEDTAMKGLLAHRPTCVDLTDNCRNTVEIVEATRAFTGADLGVRTAGRGLDVETVTGDRWHVVQRLAEVLEDLDQQHVALENITLLSELSLPDSVFAHLPERWRRRIDVLDLNRLRTPAPGRLGFARIAEFKGLESSFVILESEIGEESQKARANLYVGMTRARAALWVVNSETDSERMA